MTKEEITKKIKSKSKYWSKFQAKKIVLEAKNNIEKGKALAPELLNQKEIKFCENIQKEMKKNERMFVFSTGNKIIELEHKQLYDELKKGFPTFEAENQNYLDEITGQNGAIKFVSFYKDTDLTKLTPYSLNKSTLRNLLMSNLTPKEAAILITGHSDFVNKPKPFSVETDPQKQKDANWTYYPPYGLDDDFYCDDLSVFQKPLLEKKFEGFVFELYVWDPYLSKEKQNDVNVENQRVCLHWSN